MLFDKIIVIFVEVMLIIFLIKKFIKRYAPENIMIISILSFIISMYIFLTINNIYIPIFIQIAFLIFGFLIPLVTVFLQYNNIILTRKLLYQRMKIAYFNKNYDKTIEIIEKIVSIEGRKSEYLYILGQCYKNLKDFINARDSFALAIELDRTDYKSYYELGIILDETNKKETAMVMFNKALQIKSDFYEAEEALGICYTSQGRFREAVKVYKDALKNHPMSYVFYYNIGMIELELGEYESSKQAFQKACEIKPDLYMANYNLGKINYLSGNYDEAIQSYKKILNSGTYGPRGYYKIAEVFAAKKEYEKAMSSLEYAIELDSSYLKKISNEFIFSEMKDLIDKYLIDKENLKNKEKEKHNYMKERFSFLKKKENLLDEIKEN